MGNKGDNPKVRATAVLVEEGKILLLQQRVALAQGDERLWSLPGGTLEVGETLEECLVREVAEETGLAVRLDKLLYVCDRIADGRHVVHLTFAVHRVGGTLRTGIEPEPGASPIQGVRMVPLADLEEHGFQARFRELAETGFPQSGSYAGSVANIGL